MGVYQINEISILRACAKVLLHIFMQVIFFMFTFMLPHLTGQPEYFWVVHKLSLVQEQTFSHASLARWLKNSSFEQ